MGVITDLFFAIGDIFKWTFENLLFQLVLSLDGYLYSSDAHYLDGGYIKSLV